MARDRREKRSWRAEPVRPVYPSLPTTGPAQPGWRERFAEADRGWWDAMRQRLSGLVTRPDVAGWLAGSQMLPIMLAQQQEAEQAQMREDILRQRWTPRRGYPTYEEMDAQIRAEAGVGRGYYGTGLAEGEGAGPGPMMPAGLTQAQAGAIPLALPQQGGMTALPGAGTQQMAPAAPGPAGTPSAVYGLASYATGEWWDAFTDVHGQEPSEWYSQPDKRYPGMSWQQSANEDAAWARAILSRNIRMGVGATGPSPGEWQQHYWQMKRVPESRQYFRPQPSAERPLQRPPGMAPLQRE